MCDEVVGVGCGSGWVPFHARNGPWHGHGRPSLANIALLSLRQPCSRIPLPGFAASSMSPTVALSCSRRRLAASTYGWTDLPCASCPSCSLRLSFFVLPGPLRSSPHLQRPDIQDDRTTIYALIAGRRGQGCRYRHKGTL